MKTLRFFLILATALFTFNNAVAQNTMRIHSKNGKVQEISISGIEKIDWYEKSGSAATFENITVSGKTYKLGTSGAVDLGLSVKWATMNVGASAPGDYGDYYAWGNTYTDYLYDWSTYKYCENDSWTGITKYTVADGNTYCIWYSGGQFVGDNKTELDPEDDVAQVMWGGSWRMPTKAEQDELRTKCSWVFTVYGGHSGAFVIGSTGNAIFLPAAGDRFDGIYDRKSSGYYWSSSLYSRDNYYAYYLNFVTGDVNLDYRGRCYGSSVRPVCP